MIHERLDEHSSCLAILSDLLVRDLDAVNVPEDVLGTAERYLVVDVVGEAQGNDFHVELAESEGRSVLRERIKIHRKEVFGEFTVDVMELVFGPFLLIVLLIFTQLSEVFKIIGAMLVQAFVDVEVLAGLDL